MTVEYACDYLLLVDSRDYGAHSLSSKLFPNASSELSLKTKIPIDVLRMAFDKLVKDGYYDYGEGGQRWNIILNDKGRWFREYGGYKQLKRDREYEQDRELQALVSKSILDTNASVKKTNDSVMSNGRWQALGSVSAVIVSVVALVFPFFTPNRGYDKLTDRQPKQPQTSTRDLLSSTIDSIVLPDSIPVPE